MSIDVEPEPELVEYPIVFVYGVNNDEKVTVFVKNATYTRSKTTVHDVYSIELLNTVNDLLESASTILNEYILTQHGNDVKYRLLGIRFLDKNDIFYGYFSLLCDPQKMIQLDTVWEKYKEDLEEV